VGRNPSWHLLGVTYEIGSINVRRNFLWSLSSSASAPGRAGIDDVGFVSPVCLVLGREALTEIVSYGRQAEDLVGVVRRLEVSKGDSVMICR